MLAELSPVVLVEFHVLLKGFTHLPGVKPLEVGLFLLCEALRKLILVEVERGSPKGLTSHFESVKERFDVITLPLQVTQGFGFGRPPVGGVDKGFHRGVEVLW